MTTADECRVCLGVEFDQKNPKINPCNCKGTMGYIHEKCLSDWLLKKGFFLTKSETQKPYCMDCKIYYRLSEETILRIKNRADRILHAKDYFCRHLLIAIALILLIAFLLISMTGISWDIVQEKEKITYIQNEIDANNTEIDFLKNLNESCTVKRTLQPNCNVLDGECKMLVSLNCLDESIRLKQEMCQFIVGTLLAIGALIWNCRQINTFAELEKKHQKLG